MSNYGGGSGTWLFAPGDSVTANVTNSQTGQMTSYTFTYPAWNQTLSNYGGAGSGTSSSFAGSYGADGIGGNTASGGQEQSGDYWFAQGRAIDVGQTITAPLTVIVGGWNTTGNGLIIQVSTDGANWATIGYAPMAQSHVNYTYAFGTQTFRYVRALSNGSTQAIDLFDIY